MALFALLYRYANNPDLVSTHRPEHRQYLSGLFDRGELVLAGPLGDPGPARGLLVHDVDTPDDARRIAEADPFNKHGPIVDFSVGRWTPSFGASRHDAPA